MSTQVNINKKKVKRVFSTKVRKALIDREMSIQHLANLIGRPRPSVSAAIHHPVFPKIKKQIKEALSI